MLFLPSSHRKAVVKLQCIGVTVNYNTSLVGQIFQALQIWGRGGGMVGKLLYQAPTTRPPLCPPYLLLLEGLTHETTTTDQPHYSDHTLISHTSELPVEPLSDRL